MKKLFSLMLICSTFAVCTSNAQTGENYFGPKKGDFAITVGAEPVINFVGNMFNGNTDNSLSGIGGSLAGKYFFGDRFAITAGIGINNSKSTNLEYHPKDEDYKEIIGKDTKGDKHFSLNLGTQYYFRPGKRVQPFIGANIYCGRISENYNNSKEYDAEWYTSNNYKFEIYDAYSKTSTPVNTFGVLANLGIEIFIAKKVSISAAYDLGVQTSTYKSISKYDTDDRDVTNEQIDTKNYNKITKKETTFATGLMNGNIAFNFYF